MDRRTKTTVALIGAGGAAAALGLFLWSQFRRSKGLASCSVPRGRAAVFRLEDLDRHDHPGGQSGPPGQPASHYLTTSAKPIGDIALAKLFVADSPFVFYSIEQPDADDPFLVFLELPAAARMKMWKDEAFIDRGIRKLVELGSRVAVASFASAEAFAAGTSVRFVSGELALSFVWNTGRCGSTLMHKAISAAGAVSLSEPHWLDQLQYNNSLSEASLQRALRTCVALEMMTAQLQKGIPGWAQATRLSFNPKGGGMPVTEAVAAVFPFAGHMFMYRACHKVVESFAGLLFADGIPPPMKFAWAIAGAKALKGCGKDVEELPVDKLSSMVAAMLTCKWIEGVRAWVQACERRAKSTHRAGTMDPICAAPVVRMDEFTSKDMQVRTAVLRALFIHLGIIKASDGDEALRSALEVFALNSQQGSNMVGPKAKIIADSDMPIIKECVAMSMSKLGRVIVQDGGANIVLPGSLGVASAKA